MGRGQAPALPLLVAMKLCVKLLHPGLQTLPGKEIVDEQGHSHAHAGVKHPVQGVGHIGVHRRVEQDDTQHHAAGLHRSHPEGLGQQDEDDNAHEQQGHQQQPVFPVGVEDQVDAEQPHAQQAADDGAEEPVAAVELGVVHVGPHAEDGADAGEGGVAVVQEDKVEEGAQGGRDGGLEVAQADVQVQMVGCGGGAGGGHVFHGEVTLLMYDFNEVFENGRYAMSRADELFIQNCKDILAHGVWDTDQEVRPRWEDGTPAHTVKKFCIVNRYDLREEFPVQTIRKMAFKSAVDELLWIWQKKSNNIHDLNSHIWDAWADESGSIGKAYGYQLGVKHQYAEGMFDQVDRVLYDLKHNPASRRIMTNLYNHHDLHEMALYPCAYSMTFNVSGRTLNAILNQRSQDMLTANGWNVMQYAALVHMMAQVSGLEVGELVHVIADAHIYDRHVPMVEEIIARTPYQAPKLWIDPSVTDFYAFTKDSFKLEGYQFHTLDQPIPVAV